MVRNAVKSADRALRRAQDIAVGDKTTFDRIERLRDELFTLSLDTR